ncbi:MAG: aminotransferase class V-fold PLP-dependent enzyme [Candidatus Nanopelagicaceae bacterium]|nr:aminotransferase class V-fold PLP-dependent enzyme [Candidatus Nanopelagicaceae bacterium]
MSAKGEIYKDVLGVAAKHSQEWLNSIPSRGVNPEKSADEIKIDLGSVLPDGPTDPSRVVERLAEVGEAGLMAMGSGRFFGWVIGGTLPAALGADWLVSAWDQNSATRFATPTTAAVEEIASKWLLEILGLPSTADVGFPTGGMMANFTGLISARQKVLADVGWDLDRKGLIGAPAVRVFVGEERHDTVDRALRYLGLGEPTGIAVDDQGRIKVDSLRVALENGSGPTILCLQAGNLHSGAFDPFREAIELAHEYGAWVHVDGAFGLWALASPTLRPALDGIELADSWATDAHKTLNVPYDCGVAIVAHPSALRSTYGVHASYLILADDDQGEPSEKVPEFSRRARGVPVWAALLSLGRKGIADMVDRLVTNARLMANELSKIEGCRVLNDIAFTQVCFAFESDARTDEICARLIEDKSIWISGSKWRGQSVLRVSVSNWSTDSEDVAIAIEAVRKAAGK